MAFPLGYTGLFLPKLLLHLLTFLANTRRFLYAFFSVFGLGDFLEPDMSSYPNRPESGSGTRSVSAALIRELFPVARFSDLAADLDDNCAVCLYEFNGDDEIRLLANCRHIFHRSCLDRWMDHDQKTCPMCRTQLYAGEF